ncbi:insulinase family protein [Pseudomonas fakonensis]|uniref:Insulinase family protein n=1 Tax=Pseudomonas fakonensis TaxID=2842355 RepID=A0ABX8N615_9PSED|nr:pitrilysin family protein [Pseudomonas fakonensis]QXH51255.1 insulinase family protein [Pseudomonas fakonensis]
MNDHTPPPLNLPSRLLSAQGLTLDEPTAIDLEVQSWQTSAGTQVRFVEARGLPMVDLILRFRAGSVQDTRHSGVAALTLYNLDEGSAGLSGHEHAERLERLGAVVDKRVRLDYAQLSLRCLSAPQILEPAVALFSDLVARPDFPVQALERVKGQLLAAQASRSAQAPNRVIGEAYRYLFDGHPYGHPQGSSTEGIAATDTEHLRVFHRMAYAASNLEVVLVGDLSQAHAQAITEQFSLALPQRWTAAQLPPLPVPRAGRVHIEQSGASNTVALALPITVPANAPEYLGLVLACVVLGSGPESRIMQTLRQRHGLTYDVRARLLPLQGGGLFVVQWEVASDQVAASSALVRETLETFIHQGPSDTELRYARQQIAGLLVRNIAQNARLAELLAELGHLGQPDDYLNTYLPRLATINARQVRELSQSNLDLNQCVLVSVGPSVAQIPLTPTSDQ